MLKQDSKNIIHIYNDHVSTDLEKEEFKRFCDDAWSKPRIVTKSFKLFFFQISHSDINGEHVLAVTNMQLNKISKAYEKGTGVVINLSKTQPMHNSQMEGGFIDALLPLLGAAGSFLLKSVVPSLATGLLAGVGSTAGSAMVDNIAGRGVGNTVYIKKKGQGIKMTAAGSGLYMRP